MSKSQIEAYTAAIYILENVPCYTSRMCCLFNVDVPCPFTGISCLDTTPEMHKDAIKKLKQTRKALRKKIKSEIHHDS